MLSKIWQDACPPWDSSSWSSVLNPYQPVFYSQPFVGVRTRQWNDSLTPGEYVGTIRNFTNTASDMKTAEINVWRKISVFHILSQRPCTKVSVWQGMNTKIPDMMQLSQQEKYSSKSLKSLNIPRTFFWRQQENMEDGKVQNKHL